MTPCEDLKARTEAEQDPAKKALLQEQYERECNDPTGSGGHGPVVPE